MDLWTYSLVSLDGSLGIKWYSQNSAIWKREGNWSRNALRNCLWNRYWRRAGQLLANSFSLTLVPAPEVFANVNSMPVSFSPLKWRKWTWKCVTLKKKIPWMSSLHWGNKFTRPRNLSLSPQRSITSVNSISSIPSPVYQCKKALRLNMAVNCSPIRLNSSWIAVLLPTNVDDILSPRGGMSQTAVLTLFGIHSTK